jgi:hypothetical protein
VEQPAPVVGPYQRGGYAGIVGQLRARLGFEPRVLEVILGPQLAEFTVLDPARRGRVVSLEWNGGELTGPTVVAGADYPSPTDIHGRPVPLQSAAFPLRALRERVILGALHRLRRARVRSPTPSTMVIERFLPFDRRVLILFNVSAAGGGGRQLRFTLDGKLVQVV